MSRRVSVVVGAARGIGAATATALAARGDAVMLVDRAANDPRLPYLLGSVDELELAAACARSVAANDDLVATAIADATDFEAMTEVLTETEDRFGGVDAIIACAGVIAGGRPLWEMPGEEVDAVVDGNLRSVIIAARAGIPVLLRRPVPRTGRFVAVASAGAWRGLPLLAGYCAAKAGVVALVRALGAELRGTGVTANSVSPGSTDTPILTESARLYELDSSEMFARQQPIERLIQPAEVAELIVWLTGASAGATTGADHPIDGGMGI